MLSIHDHGLRTCALCKHPIMLGSWGTNAFGKPEHMDCKKAYVLDTRAGLYGKRPIPFEQYKARLAKEAKREQQLLHYHDSRDQQMELCPECGKVMAGRGTMCKYCHATKKARESRERDMDRMAARAD